MESEPGSSQGFVAEFDRTLESVTDEYRAEACPLDLYFFAFLKHFARFGYFSYGPINIDITVLENIVAATTPQRQPGATGRPGMSKEFDFVAFSQRVSDEMRRSGRRRIDELHFLLAFMRTPEGLPGRVFGELGVTPEQVREFAANRGTAPQQLERLFSVEEAADYLHVHVQTVRSWIKSGRLRARRLAGQRAIRITASELQSVLEPFEPEDLP